MARKNEVIKRILIVVILLTLAFIWGHSMMPGDMSGEESGFVYRILSPVLKLLLKMVLVLILHMLMALSKLLSPLFMVATQHLTKKMMSQNYIGIL